MKGKEEEEEWKVHKVVQMRWNVELVSLSPVCSVEFFFSIPLGVLTKKERKRGANLTAKFSTLKSAQILRYHSPHRRRRRLTKIQLFQVQMHFVN